MKQPISVGEIQTHPFYVGINAGYQANIDGYYIWLTSNKFPKGTCVEMTYEEIIRQKEFYTGIRILVFNVTIGIPRHIIGLDFNMLSTATSDVYADYQRAMSIIGK